MSLYGLQILMSRQNCVNDLRRLGVAYHYAIKEMLGLPKYFSNHYVMSRIRYVQDHEYSSLYGLNNV